MFTTWYVRIDEAYSALVAQHGRLRQRGPAPTFSDSEVITIALIANTFFHGKEAVCLAFVRQYHADMFPRLLDDTRFPRRRRALSGLMEAMRRMYTTWLVAEDDAVRVVDRAPIPVCTSMRSRSCTTVSGCGLLWRDGQPPRQAVRLSLACDDHHEPSRGSLDVGADLAPC